ncbi:hypothetical protein HDU85_005619 [Gaertneriomyces sp. JEL0708]|nr:hypothetical protein HDU85_005619 [Gaertneriomyces sp. JEL0708]
MDTTNDDQQLQQQEQQQQQEPQQPSPAQIGDEESSTSVDNNEDGTPSAETPFSGPIYPVILTLAPRSGYYVRFSNGVSLWYNLPPMLHSKLTSRLQSLPGVRQLSVSENNEWFVSFDDGSFATSNVRPGGRLWEGLNDGEVDVTSVVFAPGGGWLLTRADGSFLYERLPTTLTDLLSRRTQRDAPVAHVEISKLGGWFVRFTDGECEWEGLPPRLTRGLVKVVRKRPDAVVVGLSTGEIGKYFLSVGALFDSNVDGVAKAVEFGLANPVVKTGDEESPLPGVTVHATRPLPVDEIPSEGLSEIFQSLDEEPVTVSSSDDEDNDEDVDIVSSVSGSVSMRTKTGSNANLIGAPIDGNVEAEEGGRLLLRAGVNGTTKERSRWSFSSQNLLSPHSPHNSLSDLRQPVQQQSTQQQQQQQQPGGGFSSLFTSVSALFSAPKPAAANQSSSTASKSSSAEPPRSPSPAAVEAPPLLPRLLHLKSVIQSRLSYTPASHPVHATLSHLSTSLTTLAHNLVPGASHTTLAETEWFLLYVEGYLEATGEASENPWMEGWVRGIFGVEIGEVMKAVQAYRQNKVDDKSDGDLIEEEEEMEVPRAVNDLSAAEWNESEQTDSAGPSDLLSPSSSPQHPLTPQSTLDDHLQQSYDLETAFRKQLEVSSAVAGSNSISSVPAETTGKVKRDSGYDWEKSEKERLQKEAAAESKAQSQSESGTEVKPQPSVPEVAV